MLHLLSTLLYVDPPQPNGKPVCYIIGQQYSDKFPEVVMVELLNESYLPSFQYRFEIIREMEDGCEYCTAKVDGEKILPLAKVNILNINGEKFLRIDTESQPRDDLGVVPEI